MSEICIISCGGEFFWWYIGIFIFGAIIGYIACKVRNP